MNLIISAVHAHTRGDIYAITIDGRVLSILRSFNALSRISQWRLAVASVLEALLWPEEVLRGHRNRFIAHRRQGKHVVRKEMGSMRIVYSPDADVLTIQLREGKPVDSRDVAEEIIVHLSAKGRPLEIEILDASKVIQKKEIEVSMEALFPHI